MRSNTSEGSLPTFVNFNTAHWRLCRHLAVYRQSRTWVHNYKPSSIEWYRNHFFTYDAFMAIVLYRFQKLHPSKSVTYKQTQKHTQKRLNFSLSRFDRHQTWRGDRRRHITSVPLFYPENFSMWIGSIVSLLGALKILGQCMHPRHTKTFNFATRKGKWRNSKVKCRTV